MTGQAGGNLQARPPLFAEARGDIDVSFEFFPPKSEKMADTLWHSISTLAPLGPRFVSVTYGAGGSTRDRTHSIVRRLAEETTLKPAAHLTCVAATREEVDAERGSAGEFGLRVLKALIPPMVLIVAVLGSILAGIATPTEAAAVGAIGAILLAGVKVTDESGLPVYLAALSLFGVLVLTAFVDLRITRTEISAGDWLGIVAAFVLCAIIAWGIAVALWRTWRLGLLREIMQTSMNITVLVFVILIGAALFSLVFRALGGEHMVHEFLSSLPGGVVGAILLVMLVMFLLGFFLDFLEIVFVVVPIVAPVLLKMDINPIWLGIMMAVNLQTSFLTPPFGFALFYLRGVAPPQVRTSDIYYGIIPFVVIQLLALGLLSLFPELALWLPRVIFGSFAYE